MSPAPRILMCPPEYYGIEYEINPWMDRTRAAVHDLAVEQWTRLRNLLSSLGAEIRLMPPVEGLPDLVFTANAALICNGTAWLSRFRHPARQGETEHDRRWFEENGFRTVDPPESLAFEGAGDALFCGETLYAGYLIRSDALAMQWLGEQLRCRVIPVQLVDDRFYHLDTCFCPLNKKTALWFPDAFDRYAQAAIRATIPHLIEVTEDDATRFACNAVVIGRNVVFNTGCTNLAEKLHEQGFVPHETPLGEFLKAGGSAKCLTLRLDGEDAAIWPVPEESPAPEPASD